MPLLCFNSTYVIKILHILIPLFVAHVVPDEVKPGST